MCLILFSYNSHPHFPFILAANRDEFYERPTAGVRFWEDHPDVLAGRDLKYEGSWMGITKSGRFAALTNYRNGDQLRQTALSRGLLVREFLTGRATPEEFLKCARRDKDQYNGFNLLVGDLSNLMYYSNVTDKSRVLKPGVYGLSNHLLDTPWPKVERSREKFMEAVRGPEESITDLLLKILFDRTPSEDGELPDTGFGKEWEKILSSPFITSPTYGTRSSTVLLVGKDGHVSLTEWSFTGPDNPGSSVNYEFRIAGYE